jgi:hypothetical protein
MSAQISQIYSNVTPPPPVGCRGLTKMEKNNYIIHLSIWTRLIEQCIITMITKLMDRLPPLCVMMKDVFNKISEKRRGIAPINQNCTL